MQEAVTDFMISRVTASLQTPSSSSEKEGGHGLEQGETSCPEVQGCRSLLFSERNGARAEWGRLTGTQH